MSGAVLVQSTSSIYVVHTIEDGNLSIRLLLNILLQGILKSGFSALTKYILNNIDHGEIPMMTSFGKYISNTFIFPLTVYPNGFTSLGTTNYNTSERMLQTVDPLVRRVGSFYGVAF